MDQAAAKRILQELIKNEELGNKKCVDCGNPNPQWATVSFAVFLCLSCAGVHRGFGVHISFVRSVSMDTWQEEQIKRMQLGGNKPFKDFMKSYPADQSGYTEGMSAYDTYHSWAATQYREKLDAELAGKSWSPSPPPADMLSVPSSLGVPGRPSSAQSLRKSRSSGRSGPARTGSPASFSSTPTSSPRPAATSFPDQKAVNESFFAGLGEANASRPDDLPPSQGGRYQGFGNTPSPSQHPSYGLSSAAAPRLEDFQENPMAALSKGWSLFSSAVVGATRVINENVVKPGVEKVMDPNFQTQVKGYISEAGKRAGELGSTANTWTKHTIGVDVAEGVSGMVGSVSGGPRRQGYGVVDQHYSGESSSLYQDDDDFFDQHTPSSLSHPTPTSATGLSSRPATTQAKKDDDWDEWKDF
ncbi:hypothetical protein BDY19DRAFT_889752 [Irpex rosettiformis]|uniref:Uncharacterized protein n=1 Tax=Irpex rosettiformis TaxID=378272 RepID=A0ACB8U4A2_9APHY|nr:hypothetical protein BDY19DRAFT_889752 [Irpex rosettiformis]